MLKKYFIPHEENEYKPHFFRETCVIFVSFALVGAFGAAVFHQYVIERTNLLAEILPKALMELANSNRAERSLRTLTYSPTLQAAARQKAADMALKGYFSHDNPEGLTPWYWFKAVGYDFSHAGENLAMDFSDSVDVNRAWMNSPGHRANILNQNFTEIGVAMTKGSFQGRETTFVVQMFGRPAHDEIAAMFPVPREMTPVQNKTGAVPEPRAVSERVLAEVVPVEAMRIVKQNEMFIAFEAPVEIEAHLAPASLALTKKSSLTPRLFSSPSRNLSIFYRAVGLLVALALLLMVLIKIRIQHPRNIAYGVGMLALLFFLFAAYKMLFVGSVIVT